jgi:N-acetylglucosamine malate deacetylase 2
MMKILYIFPHPDDESFGPAPAIARQLREGHQVYLLTLTRGGATKQRFKYGYSIEEMGKVRLAEMQQVAKILGLTGMTVLDLPDSGLKEMDPREIESVVQEHINLVKPHVVVTYAVHGISGYHDHLVGHAVVKRAFMEILSQNNSSVKRLAFFTIPESFKDKGMIPLNFSTPDEIDCIITPEEEDWVKFKRALDCYQTYKEVIQKSNIKDLIGENICFEIFQESYNPPLNDLCVGLR